jgi:hypothetical protein
MPEHGVGAEIKCIMSGMMSHISIYITLRAVFPISALPYDRNIFATLLEPQTEPPL